MIQPDRLRRRLDERSISQSELARQVGISQASINKLVGGKSYSSRHLHKIARELGTTPAYLTGETDDPDANAPPEPELNTDEAQLVSIYRQLAKADREALKLVAERMLSPRSVHSPTLGYRAET